MIRKIFSILFTLIFVPIFFIALILFSLRFSIFNANFYKYTFIKADLYNQVLDKNTASMLKGLTHDGANLLGPLSADDLSVVIKNTIDKSWAEEKINKTFDQALNYITGKSTNVSLILDLTDLKKKLNDNLATTLQNKLKSLPICTSEQLHEQQNQPGGEKFGFDCKPPTTNLNDLEKSITEGLTGKEGLLTTISDQYDLGATMMKLPFFASAQRAFVFYNIGTWLALGLSLFLLLLIGLINMKNISRMLKWLGIPLLIVAGPMLFFALVGNFILPMLLSGYFMTLPTEVKVLVNILAKTASGQFFGYYEIVTGITVLIAISMLIISSVIHKKASK